MISQVRGVLRAVGEEELTLVVEPFDIEVLVPDHAADSSRTSSASG